VKFLYSHENGVHSLGFRGEFSIPTISCPSWFSEIARDAVPGYLRNVYNFVSGLCGASQFEFSFYTRGSSIDPTRTFLRLGNHRITLGDLIIGGTNLNDGQFCFIDVQCKSRMCSGFAWNRACQPLRSRGQICSGLGHGECEHGLACSRIYPGTGTYSCGGVRLINGEHCDDNRHCATGRCDHGVLSSSFNECASKQSNGAHCDQDEDCRTDYCRDFFWAGNQCQNKREVGERCSEADDCVAGYSCERKHSQGVHGCGSRRLNNRQRCWHDNDCESRRCTLTKSCASKVPNGRVCIDNSDCLSQFCNNRVPRRCEDMRDNGEPCLFGSDCEHTDTCSLIRGGGTKLTCNGERQPNGWGCVADADCSTRYCPYNFLCGNKRSNGQSCQEHDDCRSDLYCGWNFHCQRKIGNGHGCSRSYQCESNRCRSEWFSWRCR